MEFSFQSGNVYLAIELLLAELIFLYPAPRRTHFAVRFAGSCAAAVFLAAFLPWLPETLSSLIPYMFRSLAVFSVTAAAMACAFLLPARSLLAMCFAGYASQHIAFRLTSILNSTKLLGAVQQERIVEICTVIAVYLVIFLVFGRSSARYEGYKNNDFRLDIISLLIALICVAMTRMPRVFGEEQNTVTAGIYAILCCVLALFIQFSVHQMDRLKNERILMDRLREEERKQYEISKDTIESINIRLHDVKHKIAAYDGKLPPEEVDSLKRDIEVYDSNIKTGNKGLDVLLTEKSSKCRRLGIRLSCSGDGSLLSFMHTMDIYSLFGNAVDNAIEAVEKLDPEKKLIDISIERRGDMVFLSFTNYFKGDFDLQDGLPRTTKTEDPGSHGFGMKSMRKIAREYGGQLSVSAKGELFHLNIYLHAPAA